MDGRVDGEYRMPSGQNKSSLALCCEGNTEVGVEGHCQHGHGIGTEM